MKKRYRWAPLVLLAGVLSMGQNECRTPQSPFNASGVYEGTWSDTSSLDQTATNCPITITMDHDPNAPFPGNTTFTGMATIDFSCIQLPEDADPIEASEVQVRFFLDQNGNLNTITGGLGPGVSVVLGLQGTGEDTNDDGTMDTYMGDWAYTLTLAVPNVPPFTINGTFTLERTGPLPLT